MEDWIIATGDYILSNWQTVLIGGICAVSIVVFVLGLIKPFIKRWIHNTILRKVILAWLSVLLNIPATVVSIWMEGLPEDQFWTLTVINTVATILVYFIYENTALRDGLHWLGKKILTLLFKQYVNPSQKRADIHKEVEELLTNPSVVSSLTPTSTVKSRYDDNIKI